MWPKLLACLLLLWTAADMALPIVVCNSETMLSSGDGHAALQISSSRQQGREDSQDSKYRYEDDCFCCCSHIVPTPHVNLVAVLDSSPAQSIVMARDPQATPGTLFHPPRS